MTDLRSKWLDEAIGPRVVGGRYLCGYTQSAYTVVSIDTGLDTKISYSSWSITVLHDGDRLPVTHCTPWTDEGVPRHRKDRVLEMAPPTPPVDPRGLFGKRWMA